MPEVQDVTAIDIAIKPRIDRAFGQVLVSAFVEWPDHQPAIWDHGIEYVRLAPIEKQYPRVAAGVIAALILKMRIAACHQFGVETQLREFAPRPQGKVLTIALPHPFEIGRVLPYIGPPEKIVIPHVLAPEKPFPETGKGSNLDTAFPLKTPGEITWRSSTVSLSRYVDPVFTPGIWIRYGSKQQAPKEAKHDMLE